MAKPGLCDRPPFPFLSGVGFVETGQLTTGRSTAVGDRGAAEDWVSSGRYQRWRVCMGSWGELYHIPPCPPPHPTQKMPPHSYCHHFQTAPSGVWRSWTWSLCSLWFGNWTGTTGSIFSCLPSFGGSHLHPPGTPLTYSWGIKRVYKCQVEGCSEGPSTSHAAICAHMCWDHLGVRLACPSCTKTFLNLDALRHHKKVHSSQ